MSAVAEVAPDLFVLTDCEPIDERLSWFPPGTAGFQPHNKFLLKGPDGFLLIDTGVALHGPSLLETLQHVVGTRRLTIILTRNELDCNGNLALLLDEMPDVRVLTMNVLPALGLIHRHKDTPVERLPRVTQGTTLAAYGFPNVRAIAPLIRTLGTSWLIDDATATLFCSDFFGADQMQSPDEPVIRRDLGDFVDVGCVRDRLLAKFDWLARARTDLLEKQWDSFFATFRSTHLAPALARIQSGTAVAAQNIDVYRTALFGAAARRASA